MIGFGIKVAQSLKGSRRAVRQGNTIYLSPAMYDLVSKADPEELWFLLEHIEIVTIPEPRSVFAPFPPTTTLPPAPSMTRLMVTRMNYLGDFP